MVDFKVAFRTTLLLVDDDIEQLQLRALVLKMSGFTVVTAAGAAEAISILAQYARCRVDVAVFDYEMSPMNGCVLANYLRARYPNLRIILHSSVVGIPESEMKSVDGFVAKADGMALLLEEISVLAQCSRPGLGPVVAPEACLYAASEFA